MFYEVNQKRTVDFTLAGPPCTPRFKKVVHQPCFIDNFVISQRIKNNDTFCTEFLIKLSLKIPPHQNVSLHYLAKIICSKNQSGVIVVGTTKRITFWHVLEKTHAKGGFC